MCICLYIAVFPVTGLCQSKRSNVQCRAAQLGSSALWTDTICCHPLGGPSPTWNQEEKSHHHGTLTDERPRVMGPAPACSPCSPCSLEIAKQQRGVRPQVQKVTGLPKQAPRSRACLSLTPREAAYLLNFQPANSNRGTYHLALGNKKGGKKCVYQLWLNPVSPR